MGSINKIAVLYGGSSSERDISLQSGIGVHKAIIELGFDSDLIDYSQTKDLKELKDFDFVFNALHGFEGEGGKLQQDLDNLNILYSGSKSEACINTWNKKLTKEILKKNNIRTPIWKEFILKKDTVKEGLKASSFDKFRPFEYLFLKPQEDGSSVDIFKIKDDHSLAKAFQKCTNLNREFMLETFIDGPEFTVTIIDDECLPPIEIISKNDFYDYDAKYISDDTILKEANLNEDELAEIKMISIDSFRALNCRAWGRVDLIKCSKTGKFYVIEINTVPGMTSHSCVPKSASFLDISYKEIVRKIIDASI